MRPKVTVYVRGEELGSCREAARRRVSVSRYVKEGWILLGAR